MSFFDRFLRRSGDKSRQRVDSTLRQELVELVLGILREKDGRIRAEDAISAAATIVGERCIDSAGHYALRDHDLVPGSRVFSTRANELICGDVSEGSVSEVPKDSIIGMLRSRLETRVYSDADFPNLPEVFRQYAARQGDPDDWGKVPLSVDADHRPFAHPLRVGYETRTRVDEILRPICEDKVRCLRIAVEGLAEILTMVSSVIDHKLALMLAIETINGMSKTAPMTEKGMQPTSHSQTPAAAAEPEADVLVIRILADGSTFVGDTPIAGESLAAHLQSRPPSNVHIVKAVSVTAEQLKPLLVQLQGSGAKKVVIAGEANEDA